jgi:uncharacterized protein (TIGR02453 family)
MPAPPTREIGMPHFEREALAFLRGLARNNRKPWFEAHREDYERHVRQPMAELVELVHLRFAEFAPEMVGDPKRSMFRIHRDVRFSGDKSPYKTHAASWFFHRDGTAKVGREAHGGGAGFYFHLEPGASFVGGGCWMPPRPALRRFRAAIAEDPRGFERIALAPGLRRRFGGLSGEEMLKRAPRGYPEDHPAVRWLRYQSFTMGRPLSDAQVTGARLVPILEADYRALLPLVRWLNGALGLEPARGR